MKKLGFIVAFVSAFGISTVSAQSMEEEQAAMEADDSGDGLGSPAGDDSDTGDTADSDGTGGGTSDTGTGDPAGDDGWGNSGRLDDEQAEAADEDEPEQFRDSTDPFEEQDTDYFFLGALGRAIIIPGFIQTLFVDGGIDGFNPGTGLAFNWRRNQFNIIAQVWWNNAEADGFFRASGDPVTDTEYIDVNLGVVFIQAAFLWGFPITDWFAFEVGFDLGVGFIYGDLIRTEAHNTAGPTEEPTYERCNGPGDPGTSPDGRSYCEPRATAGPCYDTPGGHYDCVEPNWTTEGGDTPLVFPWVSLPHIALRFNPIHQFQIRIDGGYGLYNFFFGGSLSYGF